MYRRHTGLSSKKVTLSVSKGSAPLAKRCRKTANVPVSAEMCNGVFPSDIAKFVSAPDLINIRVHFSPRDSSMREAMCNGVSPIAPPKNFTDEVHTNVPYKLQHKYLNMMFKT